MPPIRTTHVGSLPRSPVVADLLFAARRACASDPAAYDESWRGDGGLLRRQRGTGIDIPSDGETSKISYATYVKDRLTGFDGDRPVARRPTCRLSRLHGTPRQGRRHADLPAPALHRPDRGEDPGAAGADIAAMKAAMDAAGYAEGFMNAASPGVIALFQPSDLHPTLDAYLADLAEGMRHEYEASSQSG